MAVLSALLASTCCVLPLVLVLIGMSGAWLSQLAMFKAWVPLLVVVALAALGWAGFLLFSAKARCAIGGDACDRVRPATRYVFVACTLFIALLLLFPLFAPLFY